MKKFLEIFVKNWDMIILSIIAAICFQVMSYGQSIMQKTIFTFFTAVILVFIYSIFQWATKLEKNKNIILVLITIVIILSIPILKIIISIIVYLTK